MFARDARTRRGLQSGHTSGGAGAASWEPRESAPSSRARYVDACRTRVPGTEADALQAVGPEAQVTSEPASTRARTNAAISAACRGARPLIACFWPGVETISLAPSSLPRAVTSWTWS
jgi:hypothetical protein